MSSANSNGHRRAGWAEVQHTADAGLEAWAPSLAELLRQAACGMLNLIADRRGVRRGVARRVEATGDGVEELLVNWLSELNFQHQVHGELYAEVVVDEASESEASGRAIGEPLDPARHELRSEIKGVTYHGLEVKRGPEGWTARVLFDV
jgi:SHS2 domain-containing protein